MSILSPKHNNMNELLVLELLQNCMLNRRVQFLHMNRQSGKSCTLQQLLVKLEQQHSNAAEPFKVRVILINSVVKQMYIEGFLQFQPRTIDTPYRESTEVNSAGNHVWRNNQFSIEFQTNSSTSARATNGQEENVDVLILDNCTCLGMPTQFSSFLANAKSIILTDSPVSSEWQDYAISCMEMSRPLQSEDVCTVTV
jgi:hypothetical protein